MARKHIKTSFEKSYRDGHRMGTGHEFQRVKIHSLEVVSGQAICVSGLPMQKLNYKD